MKLRLGIPKGSLQESTIALLKRAGLNVYKGALTYKAVADAQGLPYKHAEELLGLSY